MRPNLKKRSGRRPNEVAVAASLRVANDSFGTVVRDLKATIARLRRRTQRFQSTVDAMPLGVCFFDEEARLALCNRRYANIYGLSATQVQPGATFQQIVERRFAANSCPAPVEEYLEFRAAIRVANEPKVWIDALPYGRALRVSFHPMREGGWIATHEDVTAREDTLAVVDQRVSFQTLIDLLPDYLCVKDTESRFIVANKAIADDYGRVSASDLIGLTDIDIHGPDAAKGFRTLEKELLTTGRPMVDQEELVVTAAGKPKWISSTKVPLRNEKGEIVGLVAAHRDISARKSAEALRDGQAEVLEMVASSAPLATALDRLVRVVESQLNGIFALVMLLDEDGCHLRLVAAPNLAKSYLKAIDGVRIGPKAGSCGAAAYRRESVIVADVATDPLWRDYREAAIAHGYRSCWATPIISHVGGALGVFAMYSATIREPTLIETRLVDMAVRMAGIAIDRKRAENRIHFMATHDSLTGLPNRALLKDRLAQALLFARRYDRWATVAFVDPDNFKVINDSLGHSAGDEVLKAVAARMLACLRSTDTVVRLGGDEFVIVLSDQCRNAETVSATLQKVQAALVEPIDVRGRALRVTSSIGVANYPIDGCDTETLLANADAAMYRAKEIGRDNFQFYSAGMNVKVHEKLLLQEELRNAIDHREFVLLYQPQVDLRTGRVFAAEALIRWKHTTLGMLSPARFIPLAEETGLIGPIGVWVLYEACRQNKAWQDAGLAPITMCVNVSARQFKDKRLTGTVADALQESGLEAKYLELELTESLIMQNVDQAVTTMEELQDLGVGLSIDDFGTGYSSLGALKAFPVTRLKIDRSFINDLPNNEKVRAVATAVMALGQKLCLRVIAEGVETDEQVAFLRENNCDEMQGYHFSKPIPACDIEEFLRAP